MNRSILSTRPFHAAPLSFLEKQIDNLWNAVGALGVGETTTTDVFTTAVYDLLPANPTFTHYMGSLTTPPCTQVSSRDRDGATLLGLSAISSSHISADRVQLSRELTTTKGSFNLCWCV